MSSSSKTVLATAVIAVLVAAGFGYWVGHARGPAAPPAGEQAEPLFYRHPMNPEITSDVPAKDEMGMDYVPVYAGDRPDEAPGTVRIDPVVTQNIGVRTAVAQRRDIARSIRTVGRIAYDEQRIVRLHPKTDGWIEELWVDTTGQPVEADDILLAIYSPQLVTAQQEYLVALQNLETLGSGARSLAATALERLRFLDVPAHQIDDLRETGEVKRRLHIHAPDGGVVVNVGARRGAYVTPGTELYLIADLRRVWVLVDIYQQELPWVRVGDRAEMEVVGIPGETFAGTLAYVYPYAEADTRTVKARLEFANDDLRLRPDMFVNVTVHAQAKNDVVAIPREAVIRSGVREQVFVVREPGRFEPREVRLGISSGGWTEIKSGLVPGEQVVTSAQFLIDSESKLREATAKMQEVSGDPPPR